MDVVLVRWPAERHRRERLRVTGDPLLLVVSRDALARAGWPDGASGRNALDVHVLRLRRRLRDVRLAIRTVRSRGYLLEPVEDEPILERTLREASECRQRDVHLP